MGSAAPIYLDYAASAPQRPVASAAREGYLRQPWAGANPNSLHELGRQAARSLEEARGSLARSIGGRFRPREIAFTGGGTEANNLAVLGMAEGARRADGSRRRVVISAIEHDSVLDLARPLKARGFDVALVRPNRQGVVERAALEEALDGGVALVAVMAANNETGAAQDVADLAEAAHRAGALFMTDAIQAFCHLPLDLSSVDAATFAAHKIGAPVGVGALALRRGTPFVAQSFGGGQERGVRPGTQDVAGATAFATAAAELMRSLARDVSTTSERARRLSEDLASVPHVELTTDLPYDGRSRLPGIVSLCVDGLESETLILALDEAGFEVSAGSACSSGSLEPSHVLSAMGIPRDLALGSLRVSFDERVGDDDLLEFARAFRGIVRERLG